MPNTVKATTRLFTLLGSPVNHSLSPNMHNLAFEKLGLDYIYICLDIQKKDLKQSIDSLKLFNAKGANITYPNKQEVLKYIDYISDDAKIIGSVNTLCFDDKTRKVSGYNTDARGFIASIQELGINYKGEKVIVIGTGGAGRAIAIQLAYEGVKSLIIKDINKTAVQDVKNTINTHIPSCQVKIIDDENNLMQELKDATLFVNASPLGMKNQEDMCVLSCSETLSKTNAFIYDIVYEPRQTKLMEFAKKNNLKTTNGLNMMLWQGALAFKIWTGLDMPQSYIRKELFNK